MLSGWLYHPKILYVIPEMKKIFEHLNTTILSLTHIQSVLCFIYSRPLQDGDIINIDVTVSPLFKLFIFKKLSFTHLSICKQWICILQVYLEGYHGDTSETFLIGSVNEEGRKLVDVARQCRDQAIAACGPGQPLCVIGNTIRFVPTLIPVCIAG